MNRRIGMWIAIICILVVGVSVTKMTNDFVSSNGVEAAAIANVMDPSVSLTSGMGAVESMMKHIEETIPEMAVKETVSAASGSSEPAELAEDEMAPVEAAAPAEDAAPAALAMAENAEVEVYASDMEEAAPKSPLDPAVEEEGPYMEEKRVQEEMGSEYFLQRFSMAETSSSTFWDMAAPEHVGAYYTAAEQEHVLWDHELNLVYSTIRDRLTGEEADQLTASEMEWIKERDMYANKSMSAAKNKAMQSTDYLQALTQMTKDRCYWLVEEYREVLDLKE